jgi:fucose 4-O-acetylase-like acetyltransferase
MGALQSNVGSSPPATHRFLWMDFVRGVAIVLVMIVHAGALYSARGFELPPWIRTLDMGMAPYRIPLLIFLSGILLDHSLKKGVLRFAYGKFRSLLWPYVLWTIIVCVAEYSPEKLFDVSVWRGGTYLWYMLFLAIYFFVALFVARVPHLVVAFFALAIAILMPDGGKYGERLFVLMSFFFMGAFAGQHLQQFVRILANRWSLALLPLVVGVSILSALRGPINYTPLFTIAILPGIFGLCALLYHVQHSRTAAPFKYIGRKSIVYYVTHIPVYLLMIRALSALGLTSPEIMIPACLVTGMVVATILAWAMDRSKLVACLFAAPDIVDLYTNNAARRLDEFLERLMILARLNRTT